MCKYVGSVVSPALSSVVHLIASLEPSIRRLGDDLVLGR